MTLTIGNHVLIRCCQDNYTVWDKSAYYKKTFARVDVAVGVILCVLGTLAFYGVLPPASGSWLIGAGAAQIAATLIMQCILPCKIGVNVLRGAIQRYQNGDGG